MKNNILYMLQKLKNAKKQLKQFLFKIIYNYVGWHWIKSYPNLTLRFKNFLNSILNPLVFFSNTSLHPIKYKYLNSTSHKLMSFDSRPTWYNDYGALNFRSMLFSMTWRLLAFKAFRVCGAKVCKSSINHLSLEQAFFSF